MNSSSSYDLSENHDEHFSSRYDSQLASAHDRVYFRWLENLTHFTALHKKFSKALERDAKFAADSQSFLTRFEQESSRSFHHVYLSSCELEIKPMKVESLLIKNTYVHAKISYGEKTFRTRSIPSSHYMSWSEALEEELSSGRIPHSPDRKKLPRSPSASTIDREGGKESASEGSQEEAEDEEEWIKAKFEIDLLNIRGSIKIRLIAETFPSSQEIARVEIPVFGLIDSTCVIPDTDYFLKTFPLTLSDGSRADILTTDKNQPKISLAMRLVDKKDVHGLEGRKQYGRIQVPSFSFSCIDSHHSRDVMLITLVSLELKLAAAKESMNLSAILTNLQVDNQLSETMSSVILFPTPVKSPQPVVRAHVKKKNLLSQHNLDCYETVQFVIQELELKLEQQLVLASWEMIKSWTKEIFPDHRFEHREIASQSEGVSLVKKNSSQAMTKDFLPWKRQHDDSNSFSFAVSQLEKSYDIKKLIDDEDVAKLYIDDFKIFPIKINVSFLINPTYVIRKYRKERREDLANDGASAGLYSAVSVLLWQVGSVVLDLTSSISDAPIFFNGFEAPHLFKSQADVTQILQEHYFHRALGQLYKIVFSSEVVGNPIALLNSLSVGVHDFFYEPAHALITSPTEIGKIGKGFVKGAASLVGNSTAGLIGTASTITRSVGRGVLKLSTDKSFLKAREKLQQNPRNVGEAFVRPWKDVGNGFYYGFRGLVTVPYRSAKKKGIMGVVPGLAKGVIGLGADPLVGILDAVAHCGDAAREVTKKINKQPEKVVERMRLATVFGVDGRILPYDYNVSFGTQILNAMARPVGDGETQNFLTATLMQGNQLVHDVLGGSEEVFSLEKNRRLSFSHGNTPHRGSTHYSSPLPPPQQPELNFYETFTNPLTGGGTVGVVEDDNSSDDSLMASNNEKDAHHHSNPRTNNYSNHYDDDEGEYVIHTAIIRRKVDKAEFDVVAVLSSKRLLVFEHHRHGQSTYLKKKWEGSLKQLAPARIISSEGDGALTLELNMLNDRVQPFNRRRSILNLLPGSNTGGNSEIQSSKGNQVLLKGSYQGDLIMHNLQIAINTLLGEFRDMADVEQTACHEDEIGIRHIGPWQYSRSVTQSRTFQNKKGQLQMIYRDEEDAQQLYQENKRIINKLKYHSWECLDDNSSDLSPIRSSEPVELRHSLTVPYSAPLLTSESTSDRTDPRPLWLILEERQSIQDQNQLKKIHEECRQLDQESLRLSPSGREAIRELLRDFHRRKISRNVFFQRVEEVKRLDQEEEDNQSLTSAATHEKKPKKAILRTAMNFIGAMTRRSTQRFTKADFKDSLEDKDNSTVEMSPPPFRTDSEEASLSVSNPSNVLNPIEMQKSEDEVPDESLGKKLLAEDDDEEAGSTSERIETVVPFSKRHTSRPTSSQTKTSPRPLSTSAASPSKSSKSPPKSPDPRSLSLKGGNETSDSEENKIRVEHKPSWLSRLFSDHVFTVDESLRTSPGIQADRPERDLDNLSTATKNSDSKTIEGEAEAEEEQPAGEIFDIFPNYDRFDADFDESGTLHERRFSESQGGTRGRLNTEDVNRGFDNDFSTFSFEQIKSPVASFRGGYSNSISRKRESSSSDQTRDRDRDETISDRPFSSTSRSPLLSPLGPERRSHSLTEVSPHRSPSERRQPPPPVMAVTPTPRSTNAGLPPLTERTLESQEDSRFTTLQLDQVTERLNRIEDLLVAVLSQSNALPVERSLVEDFIRPQLHDLSQEIITHNSNRDDRDNRDGSRVMSPASGGTPFISRTVMDRDTPETWRRSLPHPPPSTPLRGADRPPQPPPSEGPRTATTTTITTTRSVPEEEIPLKREESLFVSPPPPPPMSEVPLPPLTTPPTVSPPSPTNNLGNHSTEAQRDDLVLPRTTAGRTSPPVVTPPGSLILPVSSSSEGVRSSPVHIIEEEEEVIGEAEDEEDEEMEEEDLQEELQEDEEEEEEADTTSDIPSHPNHETHQHQK